MIRLYKLETTQAQALAEGDDKMFYLHLDDESSCQFNICMAERPIIPTPKQIVETYQIPGRHGSLTRLGAFEDITLPVPFNLLENENVKQKLRMFKGWLFSNKKKLRFSDDDVYYKIKHVEVGDIDNQIAEYGYFTVTFLLDPFQYVMTPPINSFIGGSLLNIGTKEAEPRITIYGSGDINLIVNDKTLQLKDVNGFIVIDSELKLIYKEAENLSEKTIGEFPLFKTGNNEIKWTGTVSKVSIEPRWRYI